MPVVQKGSRIVIEYETAAELAKILAALDGVPIVHERRPKAKRESQAAAAAAKLKR